MHDVKVRYVGDLRCEAMVVDGDQTIPMDAPAKYGGIGEAISPTEMIGAALGVCTLTMMVIVAGRNNVDLSTASINVRTTLSEERPIKVSRLELNFDLPVKATPEQRAVIEAASRSCPVRNSIHPDIEVITAFNWS